MNPIFAALFTLSVFSGASALECSDSRVRRIIVPTNTLIYHAQKECETPPKAIYTVEEGFNIKNQILGNIDCGAINYTIFVNDSHPENEGLYYMIESDSLICL